MDKELDEKDGETMPVGEDSSTNTEETTETSEETTKEAATPNGELIEYINRFAPGSDTSTPEALMEAATKIIQSMAPIYDKLYDLSVSDQAAAAFLSDLLDTGNPIKALVRNYDPEEINAAQEAMTENDDLEEDRNIYQEKISSRKMRDTEIETNRAQSEISAKEFVDEITPDEKDLQDFISFCDSFLKDWLDSKMPKENWMILWKGFKHDSNVAEAEENGMIAGRNQKIITEKATRKDLADVLPDASGGVGMQPQVTEKKKSFGSKFMDGVL